MNPENSGYHRTYIRIAVDQTRARPTSGLQGASARVRPVVVARSYLPTCTRCSAGILPAMVVAGGTPALPGLPSAHVRPVKCTGQTYGSTLTVASAPTQPPSSGIH